MREGKETKEYCAGLYIFFDNQIHRVKLHSWIATILQIAVFQLMFIIQMYINNILILLLLSASQYYAAEFIFSVPNTPTLSLHHTHHVPPMPTSYPGDYTLWVLEHSLSSSALMSYEGITYWIVIACIYILMYV